MVFRCFQSHVLGHPYPPSSPPRRRSLMLHSPRVWRPGGPSETDPGGCLPVFPPAKNSSWRLFPFFSGSVGRDPPHPNHLAETQVGQEPFGGLYPPQAPLGTRNRSSPTGQSVLPGEQHPQRTPSEQRKYEWPISHVRKLAVVTFPDAVTQVAKYIISRQFKTTSPTSP